MSLGGKIRNFRQERGLTLTQLAQKLEISPSFLSLVERDIKKPSLIMIQKICSQLNISQSYLINDPRENTITGDRLKSIRKSRSLSIDDLAELSELSTEDIENIENNTLKPTTKNLEKLSTALNITMQHFIEHERHEINLGDKVKSLRERMAISQSQLAQKANISPSLLSQIENSITIPSLETLEKVSKGLNVESSYFLVNSDNTSQFISTLNPELISLLSDIKVQSVLAEMKDLDQGDLKFIINFIEFFKLNRNSLT